MGGAVSVTSDANEQFHRNSQAMVANSYNSEAQLQRQHDDQLKRLSALIRSPNKDLFNFVLSTVNISTILTPISYKIFTALHICCIKTL